MAKVSVHVADISPDLKRINPNNPLLELGQPSILLETVEPSIPE